MGDGRVIQLLGLAMIPIIIHGIVSLIMRENEREEASILLKERIVVRPPKAFGWIAVIGMLFSSGIILIMISFPNGTESPFVFLVFFLHDLLSAYLLWIVLIWQVEVFRHEDFFILRDCWGRRHKIYYSDCTSYQHRYHDQEIIVRNRMKNFTISPLLVHCEVLIAAMQQHNVKRECDR